MQQIPLHYIKVEEQYDEYQSDDRTDCNNLHREIPLCTDDVFLYIAFTAHLFGSQPNCTFNDSP